MTDLIPSMTAATPGSSRGPSNSELSSEAIRSQKFDTSFRGYDTAQVRQFLARVGAHVSNLHDKTAGLSLELESARSVRPVIDLTEPMVEPRSAEETVELVVDTESASKAEQMLEDARREAKAIIGRANDEAGRIMLRARAESRGKQYDGSRVLLTDGPVGLGDTDVEVDAQTPDAARDQARAMISEARAVRERILTDLAKRRRTAHVQLEQLRVGREKLLETMREARRVVDVATADLLHAETEARLAAESAGRRVSEEPMPTAEQLGAELTGGRHLSSNRPLGVVVTTVEEDDVTDTAAVAEGAGGLEGREGGLGDSFEPHVDRSPTEPVSESTADAPDLVAASVVDSVDSVATPPAFPADEDETPTVELRMSDLLEIVEMTEVVEVVEVVAVPDDELLSALTESEALRASVDVSQDQLSVTVITAEDDVASQSLHRAADANPSVDGVPAGSAGSAVSAAGVEAKPVVRKRSAGAAFAQLRAGTTSPLTAREVVEPAVELAGALAKKHKSAAKRLKNEPQDGDQVTSPATALAAEPAAAKPMVVETVEAIEEVETTQPARMSEPTPSPVVAAAVAPTDVAAAILDRRGAELELLQLRVTRRLKRQLQDDHSAALSSVRRARGQATVASLLGDVDVAQQRLVDVLEPGMDEAFESGRRSIAMILGQPLKPHHAVSSATPLTVASQLAGKVFDDITNQVEAALADGSTEYATVLGSAFRDWSTDRIGLEVAASLSAAFGIAAAGQIEPGTSVTWVVDHGDDPSPDCDDNSLAGSVALGHTFPTGHALPPLGVGCRCIVVPSVS